MDLGLTIGLNFFKIFYYPVKVEVGNDLAHFWVISVASIHFFNVVFHALDELLHMAFVAEHIVNSDTRLASILELGLSTFKCCKIYVCFLVNNKWTFSAKFKDTRNQIVSCCFSHESTFLCRSSETN